MTDNPTPPEEPLTHVGWWCWRGDNHGHLATMACRSDNVPIHVPAEWADEMRAVIRRIEDDEEQPAVLPAVPVPPTTHATPSGAAVYVTVGELAHAIDNSTPYPIELDAALCRFMAERLLEMVTIAKRDEHPVWQPEEEPPPGPHPEPQDPSELRRMADEAQQQPETCGQTWSVDGTEYPPCARRAGHEEAYCRSADGKAHFLAAPGQGRVTDEGQQS